MSLSLNLPPTGVQWHQVLVFVLGQFGAHGLSAFKYMNFDLNCLSTLHVVRVNTADETEGRLDLLSANSA